MKYKTNIILILFILLITSCSQKIPKFGSGEAETVFAFPFKGENTSSHQFPFNYQFEIRVFDDNSENDEEVVGTLTIISKRGFNYATVTNLPPGKYEMFRYKVLPLKQFNYNLNYKKGYKEISVPITLEKGKITVTAYYGKISQYGVRDGRYSRTSSEFIWDKAVKNEAIEMIKKDENFEGWKIYGEE